MTEKTYPKDLGAIWEKVSKAGEKYLSISLEVNGEKKRFVAFRNKNKREDKHPDYKIIESEPREVKANVPQHENPPEAFDTADIPF